MSATLSIISNFSFLNQGVTHTGWQGASTSAFLDPFDVTLDGAAHIIPFILPTATVRTLYDDDDDFPADWDYAWIKADQDIYIQLIAGSTNVTLKAEANVPFLIPGFDAILVAANATLITGGTEPTLTDIDSIVLGNYSGTTANGTLALFD